MLSQIKPRLDSRTTNFRLLKRSRFNLLVVGRTRSRNSTNQYPKSLIINDRSHTSSNKVGGTFLNKLDARTTIWSTEWPFIAAWCRLVLHDTLQTTLVRLDPPDRSLDNNKYTLGHLSFVYLFIRLVSCFCSWALLLPFKFTIKLIITPFDFNQQAVSRLFELWVLYLVAA